MTTKNRKGYSTAEGQREADKRRIENNKEYKEELHVGPLGIMQ